MNIQSQVVSMEKLFQLAGINYRDIPENTSIDIEDKNFKIKSFNHKTNQVEFKKIIKLVRKQDSEMYRLSSNDFSFMATPEHKVFTKEYNYIEIKDIKNDCNILLDNNSYSELFLEKIDGIYPVLDISVEDNENYFSNSILSHNSPDVIGIGNAMKFAASVRIKVTKSEIQKTEEEGQEAIDITATIFKNKVAPPFKKATFTLLTGKDDQYGIDTHKEIIDYAVNMDIVKKAGAWFKFEYKGIEERFQGNSNIVKFFKDTPDAFKLVKDQVIAKLEADRNKNKPVEGSFADVQEKKERKVREPKEIVGEVKADEAVTTTE